MGTLGESLWSMVAKGLLSLGPNSGLRLLFQNFPVQWYNTQISQRLMGMIAGAVIFAVKGQRRPWSNGTARKPSVTTARSVTRNPSCPCQNPPRAQNLL